MEAIYREVGWANDDFDTRLREAVDHLLEVTVRRSDDPGLAALPWAAYWSAPRLRGSASPGTRRDGRQR